MFGPNLLELHTKFLLQKLWAKALNTTSLKHRDPPPPQGSPSTTHLHTRRRYTSGGTFNCLCYMCIAGKPATGHDALNSWLSHTGQNPPIYCCIWEMEGLTEVMMLVTLPCFPTNTPCCLPPRWGHHRSMPSCSVKQGAFFGLPLPRFGDTSAEPIHTKERKGAIFSSWGYHDGQQSMGKLGKLFIKAVFRPVQVSAVGMCEPQKALKKALNIWSIGTNDTLNITEEFSVLVPRWPV